MEKKMNHAVVSSEDIAADLPKVKRHVALHVTFLKVGEINTLKEQFDADVLLRAQWREPKLDLVPDQNEKIVAKTVNLQDQEYWHPKIYIDNTAGDGNVTSSLFLTHNENGEATVVERRRVRGTFTETLELWEFPFDVQDLSVTVMSDLPSDEVELENDPQEIHKIYKQSFIDEQEWYLYKYVESETLEMARDRADPTVRRSALTARCRAGRRPAYFIWNIFAVTFLITFLAFVTFAVKSEKTENRLQLTFTLVLTAVAFKFVVNQSLPKISYLTYLDRYIIAAMCNLAAICIWHAIMGALHRNDVNVADRCDVYGLVAFVIFYAIYNAQFIYRIAMVPYKKRRNMKRAEQEYIKTVREQAEERRKKRGFKGAGDEEEDSVDEGTPLTKVETQ